MVTCRALKAWTPKLGSFLEYLCLLLLRYAALSTGMHFSAHLIPAGHPAQCAGSNLQLGGAAAHPTS